jgi:EmrB/QacA subfamily drug resistance transporter
LANGIMNTSSNTIVNDQTGQLRPWLIFHIASLATFLVSIDTTVLYVAFHSIAKSFPDASATSISWVMNAYTLVYATCLIPAGGLADRFGRKRVFMYGVAAFILASVLCGLSPNVHILILARMLQAMGASLLGPAALSLILEAFPKEKRAIVVGAWGAIGALAAALGPAFGAWIVDSFGWEWAFYINLPIGLYCLIRGRRHLIESSNPVAKVRFDLVGMVLIIGAIALIVSSLIEYKLYINQLIFPAALLTSGVFLLAVFVYWCKRASNPLVDLNLFKSNTYRAVNIAAFFFSIAFATMFFSFFFLMTKIWGYSLPQAGLAMMTGPATVVPTALLGGRAASKYGHKVVLTLGCIIFSMSSLWYLYAITTTPDYLWACLPGQIISGIGVGLVMPSLSGAAVHDLPQKDYAIGSAINQAVRQVGTVFGVAITVAILVKTPVVLDDFHHLYVIQFLLVIISAALVTQVNTKKYS